MKLLLAIDGSVHSASALEDVTARPWPQGTTCRVLSVVEQQHKLLDSLLVGGLGDMAKRAQKALEDDMVLTLNETLSKLREKFGQASVSGETKKGNPKELIVDEAKSWGADMIVIGAHENSAAPEDDWLGVARAVSLKAPCTVLVIQPEPTSSIEKKLGEKEHIEESRVLVSVKGENDAETLVDAILNRPWLAGSHFQILAVTPSAAQLAHQKLLKNQEVQEFAEKTAAAAKEKAEKLVQGAAAKLQGAFSSDRVTAHVAEGSPRSVILQIAQDWPADLIIIGSHEEDHNVMEKLFGSTAAAVVLNAPCSIEMVKLKH